MFDNNTSFENSTIVITLSSLEYKNNNISFVYQKFDDNTSLKNLTIVITLFTLLGSSDKLIVFNI